MSTAYQALEIRAKRVSNINDALSILTWDALTMMPMAGSESRGEQIATLSAMAHEIMTAPDLPDLLEEAEGEVDALNSWQAVNLEKMRLIQRRATAIDPALVTATVKATNRAEMAWREARAKADFSLLLSDLEEVFRLTRVKASCLAEAFALSPYDALLDTYETGIRRSVIDPIFERLNGFLSDLLDQVITHQKKPTSIVGPFALAKQRVLGKQLMSAIGLDFDYARLDESQHPFCVGLPNDVRIATCYDEAELTSALMAVLHETGHALYEAGLPKAWRGQPVGKALGMAVHESQSLLIEMHVCRSEPFLRFLSSHLIDAFGVQPAFNPDNLYRDAVRVERGLIRVDADEVTYPLHIILRYELEQALLSDDLALKDLPGAWNDGMGDLLGIMPDNDANGCLQDPHWANGTIGYFPCYTLGAIVASQLFDAICEAESALEDDIARGDFSRVLGWLRANVHQQGSKLDMQSLLTQATGKPLVLKPHLDHLMHRYSTD